LELLPGTITFTFEGIRIKFRGKLELVTHISVCWQVWSTLQDKNFMACSKNVFRVCNIEFSFEITKPGTKYQSTGSHTYYTKLEIFCKLAMKESVLFCVFLLSLSLSLSLSTFSYIFSSLYFSFGFGQNFLLGQKTSSEKFGNTVPPLKETGRRHNRVH